MNDLKDTQAVLNALCDNCDRVNAVCAHYPCKQYTSIEAIPSAQPLDTQLAYYQGVNDGIEKCTEKIRNLMIRKEDY